jgi:hypothetical protein
LGQPQWLHELLQENLSDHGRLALRRQHGSTYTRRIADIACNWLTEPGHNAKPWVLFVSFVTPHYPLIAPEEFFRLYPVEKMPDPKSGVGSTFKSHLCFSHYFAQDPNGATGSHQQRVAIAAYLALCSFTASTSSSARPLPSPGTIRDDSQGTDGAGCLTT